jgi:segregation and condensation protein B
MTPADISHTIEALLFALGRPLTRTELIKQLGVDAESLEQGIDALKNADRGVSVVDDGKQLELRVSGSAATLIEKIRKDEYDRDIGKAGQEALAAVLYRGPLTRAEIDFIRGVNSSQTLRTLTMRGLVRKIPNPKDERSFLYEPTTELLATLGVASAKTLPDYDTVRQKLSELETAYRNKQENNSPSL